MDMIEIFSAKIRLYALNLRPIAVFVVQFLHFVSQLSLPIDPAKGFFFCNPGKYKF